MKFCYLDFEFNDIVESKLNLVSVAAKCFDSGELTFERVFWLYNHDRNKEQARKFFQNRMDDGYTFVSFVVEAEARSLHTLFGYMPKFKAIDLFLEYRCLLNNNHKFAYGQQYIDGKIIKTSPPKNKWEVSDADNDSDSHHKPGESLAAATFKMLGVMIDAVEKDEARNIIIRSNREEIEASAERILKYNLSDIEYLKPLLSKIYNAQRQQRGVSVGQWEKEALRRGDYAVATAKMIALGYPINNERVSKFSKLTREILEAAAQACLQADPSFTPFRWEKRVGRYVLNEAEVRGFIEKQNRPYWRKTDKKKLSLARDAFKDWYSSESEGFPGAFCRYLKTKQSLNGFMPGGKSKKFQDFIGRDGRVRPNFGIYVSQSSRSQPGATGFIPLKAHWMRIFIEPPKGKAIVGLDFSSQEFAVAAILSQDEAMMNAYKSGDVYLAFAKAAGLAPKSATKASHKAVRDLCKALVLGISYDMSAKGLAVRLSDVSNSPVTEDTAQGYIDLFYDTYPDYADWKKEIIGDYESQDFLQLPDGWIMWGDNDNRRSVCNFPVQGHGAVIMRESVHRAQAQGLNVIYTLHDALYCEIDSGDMAAIDTLKDCMQEGFQSVMSRYGKTAAVGIEGDVWSKDYDGKELPNFPSYITSMVEYVDEKGAKDLELYRQFL